MPLLDSDQQKRLLGPRDHPCYECKQPLVQNYCRQCDEFFDINHTSTCKEGNRPENNHHGHRTY